MKKLPNIQLALQLHDRNVINDKALRDYLKIDDIIKNSLGGVSQGSNEEQLMLQLSDKGVVTKEEIYTYFNISDEEKCKTAD